MICTCNDHARDVMHPVHEGPDHCPDCNTCWASCACSWAPVANEATIDGNRPMSASDRSPRVPQLAAAHAQAHVDGELLDKMTGPGHLTEAEIQAIIAEAEIELAKADAQAKIVDRLRRETAQLQLSLGDIKTRLASSRRRR